MTTIRLWRVFQHPRKLEIQLSQILAPGREGFSANGVCHLSECRLEKVSARHTLEGVHYGIRKIDWTRRAILGFIFVLMTTNTALICFA